MTDSSVASDKDPARKGRSRWGAAIRRWLGALDRFLEKGFRLEDVETGC